jgi:hypothetical protein
MQREEELRTWARMVAPHLAWDLTRSKLIRFVHSEEQTASCANRQLEELISEIKARIYNGETFNVAIIPEKK